MNEEINQTIDVFFEQFKHQTYKKGEILIRADDAPQGIFLLKSGYIKQYAISKKGVEITVNVFKPFSFFPMSWAINSTPNSYFYEAMTKAEVVRAPKEKVIEFIKNNPDVLFDLTSRVFKGTEGLLTRLTYLMGGNAYSRLTLELIIYSKRMGKEKEGRVELKISERELAAETGMTRETVSREIKILKEKGLISFTKNVLIIKNIHDLEKELSGGV